MVLANESMQDALEKVQASVNRQLDRQFRQLVDSLHGFLDDLFNYPLERPWPMTLARFAAHWDARGLRLTGASLASIERFIQGRLGPSTGDQFAEGPPAYPDLPPLNTDAVSPYAVATEIWDEDDDDKFNGRITAAAIFEAGRLQRMFGFSDEERTRLEFFLSDKYHRHREGRPPLLEPLFLHEARQRGQQGPSMQAISREQMEESIRREQAERYSELSPEERAKLDREWEREAREKYIDEYGRLAAFFNPAFAGGFDDYVGFMGGFAGAGMSSAGRATSLSQTARNRRTPRGKFKPQPVAPKKPKKPKWEDGGGRKKKEKPKPEFPPPIDRKRYPTRPDGSYSKNLRLAAESEEAMARYLDSFPEFIVLVWGKKQGTHGADIITYNRQTRQIWLWDVKYRSRDVKVRRSVTFTKVRPRQLALEEAKKAVMTSGMSPAEMNAALTSLATGNIVTVTIGAGRAVNVIIGE